MMERLTTVLIAVLSVLSVWLTYHSVEGKCRGDWKSYHGCLGGNGKRSDPSLDRAPSEYEGSNTLEKLLRGFWLRLLNRYKVGTDDVFEHVPERRAGAVTEYKEASEPSLENLLRKMVERLNSKYAEK